MALPNATIAELPLGVPAQDDWGLFYSRYDGVTKRYAIQANTTNVQNYEWVSTTTYALDEVVTRDGKWWQSLQNGNTGNIPTEGTWWTEISKADEGIHDWAAQLYTQEVTFVLYEINGKKQLFELNESEARPFLSANFLEEWNRGTWVLISENNYHIVEQNAHGFSAGQVLSIGVSGWELYDGTDVAVGVVIASVNSDVFVVLLRGQLIEATGLTPWTKYYAQPDGSIDTAVQDDLIWISISTSLAIMLFGSGGGVIVPEIATPSEALEGTLNDKTISPFSLRSTGGGIGVPVVRTLTDDDTLELGDVHGVVVFNLSDPKNCTIPASVFAHGDIVYVRRTGSGQLSFVAGSGMTITSTLGALTDAGENNIVPVIFTSTNTCLILNGTPNTAVPTSRTLAGLDLTTNRSAAELNAALKVLRSTQIVGGSYNRYHIGDMMALASFTTASLVVNNLKASPFPLFVERTLDRIQVAVTTLGSGGVFRIGIYTDNGNGYPDELVVDSGELSSDTTGVKTATINVTLQPGLYHFAIIGGIANATFRALGTTVIDTNIFGIDAAMGLTHRQPYWVVSRTYGALPSTFPTGATINNTATSIPLICVRYSA